MGGLYTSPIGASLSEITIERQSRKVPIFAISGKVENDHAIKRSMGEVVLSTKRKRGQET